MDFIALVEIDHFAMSTIQSGIFQSERTLRVTLPLDGSSKLFFPRFLIRLLVYLFPVFYLKKNSLFL